MRAPRGALALTAALAMLAPTAAAADNDAVPLGAAEVKRRWHERLDGRHFTAAVRLEMNLGGMRERRTMRVWRDDGEQSDERVLVRFEQPQDLRNVGLLYLEHGDRPNDYFLYQPSVRRVRRLPETVADDDVYGIDLEFLGFGVAQTEPTELEGLGTEQLRGRRVYVLRERARERNPRFDERTTWLDAETFVALKTEHRREGRPVLVAEALEVTEHEGVFTPMRMRFQRLDAEREVDLIVEAVDYHAAIPEEFFSVMALVRASAVRADRTDD